MLIVFAGLPGTGKSAVAALLAGRLKAVHLSIDPIEDALRGAGLPPSWETGVGAYEAARDMTEQNLLLGHTVVVDAVNDSEPARATWRLAAQHAGAHLTFVLLTLADAEEHQRRLEGRTRGLRHVPEPTWDQVQERAAGYVDWADGDCLIRLDAGVSVEEIALAIQTRLVPARP